MRIPQLKRKDRIAFAELLKSIGATKSDYGKYLGHLKRCNPPKPDREGNLVRMNMSFVEWFKIWKDSGHYEQRGPRKGQYVMSRKRDLGSYEIGNVEIRLSSDNDSEAAYRDKNPFHVAKAYASRRKIPREDLEKICKSKLPAEQVASKYNCSPITIKAIRNRYKNGLPLFKGSPSFSRK